MSLAICASCVSKGAGQSDSKETIAVSIEPLRQLVETIGGDDFEVITILDKGSNPETYDPALNSRAAVERSAALLTLGAFPFEERLAKSVRGEGHSVDVSKGIARLYGTHTHSDGKECRHEADPHVWTSVRNMKLIACNVADVLKVKNPKQSVKYAQRLDSLCAQLDSIDNRFKLTLDSVDVRNFAVWHPSLSYFANDYGLGQIAVGEENKEMSPKRLKRVIENAQERGVKAFFFQKEFDSRQAEIINAQLGSKIVTIDPLSYDWVAELELIVSELTQ